MADRRPLSASDAATHTVTLVVVVDATPPEGAAGTPLIPVAERFLAMFPEGETVTCANGTTLRVLAAECEVAVARPRKSRARRGESR